MSLLNLYKITLLLLLLLSSQIFSDSAEWTGDAEDQLWNTEGNWNPNTLPNGASNVATFPNTLEGNVYTYFSSNIELDSIVMNHDYGAIVGGETLSPVNSYDLTINTGIDVSTADAPEYSRLIFGYFNSIVLKDGVNCDLSGSTAENTNVLFYGSSIESSDSGSISFVGPGNFSLSTSSLTCSTLTLSGQAYLELSLEDLPPPSFEVNNLVIGAGSSFGIDNESDESYTLSTRITGDGGVLISEGTVAFSGNNTYTGGTVVNSTETLIGTTNSIPSFGGVSGQGLLKFDQSFNGEYTGVISGDGNVEKLGTGTLTLSNLNSYSGSTLINGGVLAIAETGSIDNSSMITVSSGILRGTGSVSSVTNNATLQAGSVAGDLFTVTGTYQQGANGTLKCFVNQQAASKLSVAQTANLSGALRLEVAAGLYPENTSYVVLDADGGLQGTRFDSISEDHSGDWALSYNTTQAIVTVTGASIVTPVSADQLSGNDRSIYDYMFSSGSFTASNTDLTAVADSMVDLPAQEFKQALVTLTPAANNALPLSGFQNNLQMAIVLDNEFQAVVNNELLNEANENLITQSIQNNYNKEPALFQKKSAQKNKKYFGRKRKKAIYDSELYYGIPKTGFFIEPVFLAYRQDDTQGPLINQGQIGFRSYTYGAGLGFEQVIDGKWIVEGGMGYTHSNLNWNQHFGNARWSSIYIAPFVGYFNNTYYANFMVMGAFDFVHSERRIQFTGLERIAKGNYHNYNILLRANGGFRIAFPKSFWLQPDFTLNYLTTFTQGYKEKGAGSISLEVRNNTNYILQPSFRTKLIKQFYSKDICFAPNVYLGWLANIPLKTQSTSARFVDAPNYLFFDISGYYETVNQIVVGAEYFMEKEDAFIASSSFEADLLSQLQVYIVKLKFQWIF